MASEDEEKPRKSFRDRMTHAVKSDLGMTPEARERKEREREERVARAEAERDIREHTFSGVLLKDGRVDSPQGGGPVAGARATVDTAGQLSARITATRLVLTGPLALGLRKKVDTRELYLLIEGRGWAISVPVDPTQGAQAREFAAKINAAGMTAESDNAGGADAAIPALDIPDQIHKLGALRDAGLLTDAEFDAKKADLLARL
jgi:hypothetical protein